MQDIRYVMEKLFIRYLIRNETEMLPTWHSAPITKF